jgi:hypothetical protein
VLLLCQNNTFKLTYFPKKVKNWACAIIKLSLYMCGGGGGGGGVCIRKFEIFETHDRFLRRLV